MPKPAAPEIMLRTLLRQVPYLTETDVGNFTALWQRRVGLGRGDFLIQAGQVEHNLYFVGSGLLRIYYPTQAEEICVGFGYANNLLCSFPSFVANRPSDYCIQALRRCELLALTRADFQQFVESNERFARFWRAELERVLVGRIEREIDLLLPEPERRLDRLLKRSPHIFQLVPKKYIASYLRMTPETLSRLR
ncbi:Crp/Fnr family transcriptional regulator [Hymenobacter sp. BT175]|uniref:Crp/Fnr family transcriptional regulator n=1 Tax=Hymenobacter translucens TaxID=2886507 RepID=UPI001D0E2EFE|nr:Crp/Fnr family transcriptional regulator [Hymenobacter translucens]MCC2545863.1 Crp/Fnr family transcriptional regulator [Hymenobacter translucens]